MADQMGLGKTLQMIALVASDADKIQPAGRIEWKGPELDSTLIVVPLPCKRLIPMHACIADESRQCWRLGQTN